MEDIRIMNGAVLRQTEKALLFQETGSEDEIWFPKSQVVVTDGGGGYDQIQVPAWLVEDNQ